MIDLVTLYCPPGPSREGGSWGTQGGKGGKDQRGKDCPPCLLEGFSARISGIGARKGLRMAAKSAIMAVERSQRTTQGTTEPNRQQQPPPARFIGEWLFCLVRGAMLQSSDD